MCICIKNKKKQANVPSKPKKPIGAPASLLSTTPLLLAQWPIFSHPQLAHPAIPLPPDCHSQALTQSHTDIHTHTECSSPNAGGGGEARLPEPGGMQHALRLATTAGQQGESDTAARARGQAHGELRASAQQRQAAARGRPLAAAAAGLPVTEQGALHSFTNLHLCLLSSLLRASAIWQSKPRHRTINSSTLLQTAGLQQYIDILIEQFAIVCFIRSET